MKVAELAGLPIKVGAAIRGARLFHPNGVLATGTLTRTASDSVGLPVEDGAVIARVSKGVGTPGGLPDVIGLAIRMGPHDGDETPWDLLLASALAGTDWRKTVPFPALSLGSAVLSTLQPLDHDGVSWWLRATLAARPDGYNPSLNEIEKGIDDGGLVFELEQTRGHTPFLPLARVELTATVSESDYPDIGFDPTTNTTRSVRPGPSWLSSIREVAYRRSRQGRDAETDAHARRLGDCVRPLAVLYDLERVGLGHRRSSREGRGRDDDRQRQGHRTAGATVRDRPLFQDHPTQLDACPRGAGRPGHVLHDGLHRGPQPDHHRRRTRQLEKCRCARGRTAPGAGRRGHRPGRRHHVDRLRSRRQLPVRHRCGPRHQQSSCGVHRSAGHLAGGHGIGGHRRHHHRVARGHRIPHGGVPGDTRELKAAIAAGIGAFIAFIGFVDAGFVKRIPDVAGTTVPVSLGINNSIATWPTLIFVFGVLLMGILVVRKVRGGLLIGIVVTTVVAMIVQAFADLGPSIDDSKGWSLNIPDIPSSVGDLPNLSLVGDVDLFGAFTRIGVLSASVLVFALVLSNFFDAMGTMTGLGKEAELADKDGNLPNIGKALVVEGTGAIAGGVGSASSNTVFVESASGIAEGARTGLANVVTGVLFLIAMFFTPLYSVVPLEAAAPALVVVGAMMISQVRDIDLTRFDYALPCFLTIVVMPFTYSIANGIGVGFITWVVLATARGRIKTIHPLLWVVAALFVLYFAKEPIETLIG